MLAKREDLNVPHNDELVVVFVEDCAVDNVAQVLLVALGEEEQRLRISVWCVEETLAVGVFAQALQHGPDGARQLLEVRRLLLVGRILPPLRAYAGPAKPIEVDGGVLRVGAMRPAGRERRLRNGALVLVVVLCVAVSVSHLMSVVRIASVAICCGSLCGEVTSRPVEVYYLAAPV